MGATKLKSKRERNKPIMSKSERALLVEGGLAKIITAYKKKLKWKAEELKDNIVIYDLYDNQTLRISILEQPK